MKQSRIITLEYKYIILNPRDENSDPTRNYGMGLAYKGLGHNRVDPHDPRVKQVGSGF